METLAALALKYLGSAAVDFALGVLDRWMARRTIERATMAEHDLADATRRAAVDATIAAFLERAVADPHFGARLRVQPGAASLHVVRLDADPPSDAAAGDLSARHGDDPLRRPPTG